MTVAFRRFALGAVMLGVLAATAAPAFAQAASPLSLQLRGVRFDSAWRPAPATSPRIAATSSESFGQSDSGIGFGVLAGIVRTSFHSEDFEDFFESNTGTMLGVWVGGNRNGRVGFTGEFIYLIRKSDTFEGELKFPALEIPAVIHVNFGSLNKNNAMGYAIVGPVFTINLKQKLDGIDVSDNFNGADIGIMAGGGFEILRFAVEVRGNWGLRNINTEGELVDLKTRSIEFLAKFRIN